jgi:integrase
MPKRTGMLLLKAIALRSLPPGRHADGGGLYLAVSKNGAGRSWMFRTRRDGKLREMGLGSWHSVTLEKARRKAAALRDAFLDGRDPIAEKKAARQAERIAEAKATTFEQAAQAYIRAHRAGWKSPKSQVSWEHTLSAFAYPVIGKLPVAAIDTDLVMKVLGQEIADGADGKPASLWNARPETPSRLRGRLESILDYARVIGQRQGENPARWRGHLDHLLPARQAVAKPVHHPALPYRDLPAFLAELRERDGIAARALEFAILTAARTGEVIGARWAEIDLDARLWTIPGSRMKAGREHRVPLSGAALAILQSLSEMRTGDRVFPVSNMAMAMLLRRMGRGELTVHGFRSSFSDWCAEQTSFPSEVREMALAHAVGDKVEAAYRRGDLFEKRRQLAEAWAHYCEGEEPAESKVVRLAGRAG